MPENDREVSPAIHPDEERVRREYARRAADPRMQRYRSRVAPALARAQRERLALIASDVDRLGDRRSLRLLDVGCGDGSDLFELGSAGFAESRLAGIDVVEERIATARARLPTADIRLANAADLPFPDGTFDAVIQSTTLSSVVDSAVRQRIAGEMLRVTRSSGLVFSYDMALITDRNPHLVAIDQGELRRLFGTSLERVSQLTLLMPIASRAPAWLRRVADRIGPLHSHLLAVAVKDRG